VQLNVNLALDARGQHTVGSSSRCPSLDQERIRPNAPTAEDPNRYAQSSFPVLGVRFPAVAHV